jgi:hypothetical protein
LNGDLLHAIVEFKDFGFVGMAFRRLVGHFWRCNNLLWGLLVPYCAEIPFRWSKDVPQLLGDFFLAPSGLEEGLNLIPLFKTDLGVVFFHLQCKDCTPRLNGIKGPQRPFCRLFS